MRTSEFLTEEYDVSKARIDHLEDSVFSGSAKVQQAIAVLEAGIKNPKSIRFKPDGKPAVMWGNDANGFAFGDKYMQPLPHSMEEMQATLGKRSGGANPYLISLYTKLWPSFSKSVKTNMQGYLFGDLMFAERPGVRGKNYSFKPNTVTYQVPKDSKLGAAIGKCSAGVILHTLFKDPTSRIGQHVNSLSEITEFNTVESDYNFVLTAGGLIIISDQIAIADKLHMPKQLTTAKTLLSKYGKMIDQMLYVGHLNINKITGLPGMMAKFVNQFVIYQKNTFDLDKKFLAWLETHANPTAFQRMSEYLEKNKQAHKAMWMLFVALTLAKGELVHELDVTVPDISAGTQNGPGHEGFVLHSSTGPVKLVDRFRFSAANLSSHV